MVRLLRCTSATVCTMFHLDKVFHVKHFVDLELEAFHHEPCYRSLSRVSESSSHCFIRLFKSTFWRPSSTVWRCVASALTKLWSPVSHKAIEASARAISSSISCRRSSICWRLIGFRRFPFGSAEGARSPFTGTAECTIEGEGEFEASSFFSSAAVPRACFRQR